jgi:hypothetical protein
LLLAATLRTDGGAEVSEDNETYELVYDTETGFHVLEDNNGVRNFGNRRFISTNANWVVMGKKKKKSAPGRPKRTPSRGGKKSPR